MAAIPDQIGKIPCWSRSLESPVGMAHWNAACPALGKGIARSEKQLATGIARVLFVVDGDDIVLLQGFIKKTQKIPPEAVALAEQRRHDYGHNQEK